jgi:hypothetical protein
VVPKHKRRTGAVQGGVERVENSVHPARMIGYFNINSNTNNNVISNIINTNFICM